MGMEEGLFACAYTLYTHALLLGNRDVLTQFQFIATIHEVNNVRSSQPRTITAYNGFFLASEKMRWGQSCSLALLDMWTSWRLDVVLSTYMIHC